VDLCRPLGDGLEEADQIHLLERLAIVDRVGDLTHQGQHGHRLGARVMDADREVGRARPARRHAHADASAGPRVAVGHERRHLLVAGGEVPDVRLLARGVDQVHDRGAGQAEDVPHALAPQGLDGDLRSVHVPA
jgi:hypothetical protein